MINRREFGQRALTLIAGVPLLKIAPLAAQVNSRINGVRTGLQSACFTFSGIGQGIHR
jgi:hypothetical protein